MWETYVEVNMYVMLWSHPLTEVTEQKQVTETLFTLLQDSVPSTWFRSCYFKVEKQQNIALKMKN